MRNDAFRKQIGKKALKLGETTMEIRRRRPVREPVWQCTLVMQRDVRSQILLKRLGQFIEVNQAVVVHQPR
jgi:hypothetical protein